MADCGFYQNLQTIAEQLAEANSIS